MSNSDQIYGSLYLGHAYLELGDAPRAIPYCEQALTIVRAFDDCLNEGIILGDLACAYVNLGEAERAIELCLRARGRLQGVGAQREEGDVLCTLGMSYAALDDRERARSTFEAALTMFHAIGNRSGAARCRWEFGLALARWGRREQALPMLRAALIYEQESEHTRANQHAALLADLEAGEPLPPEPLDPMGQCMVGEDQSTPIN